MEREGGVRLAAAGALRELLGDLEVRAPHAEGLEDGARPAELVRVDQRRGLQRTHASRPRKMDNE